MKSKAIFFLFKNLLKSKSCKKIAASVKALASAKSASVPKALQSALTEAAELIIKNNKSQYFVYSYD